MRFFIVDDIVADSIFYFTAAGEYISGVVEHV
jgi:hypothetical protein